MHVKEGSIAKSPAIPFLGRPVPERGTNESLEQNETEACAADGCRRRGVRQNLKPRVSLKVRGIVYMLPALLNVMFGL